MAGLLLVVAAPLAGCGAESGASPSAGEGSTATAGQCRRQWADLAQLHAENGDPGGPVPALQRRWRQLDRTARRYAEQATAADCGRTLEQHATEWGDVESLEYDLAPFDPRRRLERAEADRRHWVELQEHFGDSTTLSPPLRRAFRVARRTAPRAEADLAEALAPGADLDVSDRTAVAAYLAGVGAAARSSEALGRFDRAIEVIAGAELHEE